MKKTKYITIFSKKKKIELNTDSILYIIMRRDKAEIHVAGNKIYETWISLCSLRELLGDEFIQVHRGCLVSAMAIHDITDKVNLINGDSLDYTIRKKKLLMKQYKSPSRAGETNKCWRR